jgi:transposase-like protein
MTKRTNEDEARLARELEMANAAVLRSAREQAQERARQAALMEKQSKVDGAHAVVGWKDGAHG